MRPLLAALLFAAPLFGLAAASFAPPAVAQENARQEAARRAKALADLPSDAARRLFGNADAPASGKARSFGFYSRGCFAGGVALPADGDTWQAMRLSRNRNWGRPELIAFLERFSRKAAAVTGWPGLLIGDIAQPRGGPMLTGHASHQLGIEADVWLTPMPRQRFSASDREEVSAVNLVRSDWMDVDPAVFTPQHVALLKAASREPQVARIFVNPAIKKALCREAGSDRGWLRKIRPTYGHNYHFHIRLACLQGDAQCRDQDPPPPGDGCGSDLAWWFTPEAMTPKPSRPPRPLTLADLPPACRAVLQAD